SFSNRGRNPLSRSRFRPARWGLPGVRSGLVGGEKVPELFQEALALRGHLALVEFGQFAEQFFLLPGQVLGGFHDDLHQQISGTSAPQMGHALVRNPYHFAALNPALEFVRQGAPQGRNLDFPSQGRLAEGNRHLADETGPIPLEKAMFPNPDDAVQVSPRRPRVAGLSFATQPDARAVIDSGRHPDLDGAPDDHAAAAVALGTRIGNDVPAAAAAPTGLLHPEKALTLNHRPGPVAAAADRRLRTAPAAVAGTIGTQLTAREGHRFG